jgi:hemoglobin-like flavoprotein
LRFAGKRIYLRVTPERLTDLDRLLPSALGKLFAILEASIVSENSSDKVAAIFELREAVAQKVHAEYSVERDHSPEAGDALLDAILKVAEKTQDAVETCHACDRPHAAHEPHEVRGRIGVRSDNVVDVDFRPE